MAFAFGVIFCGILAYAGLRSAPISDPGQFFFLRVLAAISAAGVAAVIPGMLQVQIGQGKLLALRGAGALAVFAVVYLVNPPDLIHSATQSQRAAMEGAYGNGQYEDALRFADDILKANSEDAEALNIEGGVAFYNGEYASAVEFFRRANKNAPKNVFIASNYADSLFEVGAYQKAIEVIRSIDDGKRDRSFSLGRAYLYAGNLPEARTILATVPSNYWHGAARILEATAILSDAKNVQNPQTRLELNRLARQKFEEGYRDNKEYWDGIFSGDHPDIHLTYTLPVQVLASMYTEVAAR